jgi:aminopeptidase-like protein
MKTMMQLLADLTPLNRVICSSDYDYTIEYMKEVLPFKEVSYSSSEVYNGWVIPPKWDVKAARINYQGRTIYDGLHHPLAVMALSAPFRGTVDREELRQHLHYDHRYENAIPFHFRQLFRSYDRDWGFCVPRTFYDSLQEGFYDVAIETEEAPGTLRVLDYTLEGRSPETVVFGANLDHPGVANDGLAGVAVGVALFDALHQCKQQTNFSYRLVLAPGIIGNEYYLGHLADEERTQLLEGVMLEMLGSPTELSLQFSRSKESNIEIALAEAMEQSGCCHHTGAFESALINDEYIWEAYGIPMASLSRFPYPEYHTDLDSVELMNQECLEEAVGVLLHAIETLESSSIVRKRFAGNICLSHPEYNLYIDPGQVAFGDIPDDERRRMRLLMDVIPTLTRTTSMNLLAVRVGLPLDKVEQYLEKWVQCGLLERK